MVTTQVEAFDPSILKLGQAVEISRTDSAGLGSSWHVLLTKVGYFEIEGIYYGGSQGTKPIRVTIHEATKENPRTEIKLLK